MLIVKIQQILLLHFTKSIIFGKIIYILFSYFFKHCPKIFICGLETFLIEMILLLKSAYKLFRKIKYLSNHKLFFFMNRIIYHMLIWVFGTVALPKDLGSYQGDISGLTFCIVFSFLVKYLRYHQLWHCAQSIKTNIERISLV